MLHRLDDGNTNFLLEAAGKSPRVLFVQGLQLETRIDPLLDGLPKPRTFGDCQGDVVHVPKFTDHTVKPMWRSHVGTPWEKALGTRHH